jgi:hypothetical protein
MADKINSKVFDYLSAAGDNTKAEIFKSDNSISKENVHDALMVAGMTPVIGNVADAVDAGLYLLEGKYGSAGLSAASMIPFLGNWVAGKRALLKAKLAGEEMVTLYRGVEGIDDANTMVKNNNIIGNWGKTFDPKKSFGSTTSTRKPLDSVYGKKGFMVSSVPKNVDISKTLFATWNKKLAKTYTKKGGMILEFEVPKSYINKYGRNPFGSSMSRKGQGWGEEGFKNAINASYDSVIFTEGLPVDFLKTTHKGIKAPDPVLKYQELKDKILKDR